MAPSELDTGERKEKPFKGMKIYYSGSIRGVPNPDSNFAWGLVQFMAQNGADVLSEHVAARNRDEMFYIFHERTGIDLGPYTKEERAKISRKGCLDWVREATHFVALVDNPSLGVGIEIQETIRKPQLGFNKTPMLFLVHQSVVDADKLSYMVIGIDPEEEGAIFEIGIYTSLGDAREIVYNFLTKYKTPK